MDDFTYCLRHWSFESEKRLGRAVSDSRFCVDFVHSADLLPLFIRTSLGALLVLSVH
jgi:hypothetical protein